MAQENRGGDHKSKKNEGRREAIRSFLESLKCQESHYCRSKSACRVYLPPELNIRKLYQMYLNSALDNVMVKEPFFRREFCTKYNIGFGSPRTDVCSTCIQISEKIKQVIDDPPTKAALMAQKTVHKLKVQAFFALLKEEYPEMIMLSFECQKNLPLPKLPDQEAYCSKQYNFYYCLW
ncbi:unnamed protein product [Acanthoscelides obtectus]|uniref:Uncharacterized protein n=1 Tax=Acanthoscelides obtectus TaxID=200917 RepID=A0A9P0KTC5_ACAOB|nr:unnamed protein product [Acanthoscelides obtectus]CAK1672092.1 hypothetical protein AOBTE_LOCUS28640 [Acanthoscelides obtectus]